MKIYGIGVFTAPGSSRVIHDFVDGPFDCVNPVLIAEAKRRGYLFSPPSPEVFTTGYMRLATDPEPSMDGVIVTITEEPKDTPKKRGRKPKGVANVNATTDKPS